MSDLDQALVDRLRTLASWDMPPTDLLREILPHVPKDEPDCRTLFVRYFKEAFCLLESPFAIFGWQPDGTGELTETALDALLTTRIAQTQSKWKGRNR
jgi:hypothetical protein